MSAAHVEKSAIIADFVSAEGCLEIFLKISVRRPILQGIENSTSVWLVAHASHSRGRDDVTLETVTTTRYAGNRCIVATRGVLADFGWTIGWIGAADGRN